MYAAPHNRERPSLTFKALSSHEYGDVCRIGVVGVIGLIPPGLLDSPVTDGFLRKGFLFSRLH